MSYFFSYTKKVEDNSLLGLYCMVAYKEECYHIIRDVNKKDILHAVYKKTFDKVRGKISFQ